MGDSHTWKPEVNDAPINCHACEDRAYETLYCGGAPMYVVPDAADFPWKDAFVEVKGALDGKKVRPYLLSEIAIPTYDSPIWADFVVNWLAELDKPAYTHSSARKCRECAARPKKYFNPADEEF